MTVEQDVPNQRAHEMEDWVDPARGLLYRTRTTHMIMLSVTVVAFIAGAFHFSPADWHPLRIVAAGVLCGLGAYLSLFVNWILVADW